MNGHGHMIVLFAIGVLIQKKEEVIVFAQIAAQDFIHQKRRKKNDLPLFATVDYLHSWRDCREAEYKDMIQKVVVKTVDAIEGRYAVFADGIQIADKISMVTFFMEVGKTPHMIVAADFLDLEIDGVDTEVIHSEPIEAHNCADEEIQHVSYDDAQLGREK